MIRRPDSPGTDSKAEMKILVTGSAGRLGARLRRRFETLNEVDVLYLRNPKHGSPEDVSEVDVTDSDALIRAVDTFAPDSIVHLASIAGSACEDDVDRAYRVNVGAVETIAVAARDAGVSRVIFASTSAVYGDQYDRPVSEDDGLNPKSIYARTKQQAEEILDEYARGSDSFRSVSLRIFNVYGPGFDGSLVSKLRNSSPAHRTKLRNLDTFVRDYSHVDSVVDAIQSSLTATLATKASNINIGSGIPTTNRALVEHLRQKAPVYFDVIPGDYSYSCADISSAAHVLGFEPSGGLSGA